MCRGSSLCCSSFGLVVCARSLPFVGFRSLVGVSFYSFLFFSLSLGLLFVCVVNALIKEEIEDHV
jgi:hypothetical protein